MELPYTCSFSAKGRTYWYYRRHGQRVRLEGVPGTPEFLASYQRTHDSFERQPTDAKGVAEPGSMAAMITAYKAGPEFAQLSAKTRNDYRRYLDRFAADLGRLPVARMERKHVLNYRDRFAATPRTANYVVQVLRLLLGWGVDRGWLKANPAARPKQLKTGEGHRAWEEMEIEVFRERWPLGTVERTAFELALNTGQRGEDLTAMERAHIGKDGTIAVAQEKTKARVWIPQSATLMKALESWDKAQENRAKATQVAKKAVALDMKRMVLTTESGKAFQVDHFRHVMIDAYQATAGLRSGLKEGGVTTHGLRYTAATRLHELGLDWNLISAITGHETVAMVRKYTDKKRLAKLAIASLDAATGGKNEK